MPVIRISLVALLALILEMLMTLALSLMDLCAAVILPVAPSRVPPACCPGCTTQHILQTVMVRITTIREAQIICRYLKVQLSLLRQAIRVGMHPQEIKLNVTAG